MKKVIIIIAIIITTVSSSAQINTKDVGAGVIDFLITNPKTANNLNDGEYVALKLFSGLLKKSSQRQHEQNIHQSQTIVITDGQRTAKIVYDQKGNMYMLLNDMIYPINQSLIDQAKTTIETNINGATLPAYNKNRLRQLNAVTYPVEKTIKLKKKIYYSDLVNTISNPNEEVIVFIKIRNTKIKISKDSQNENIRKVYYNKMPIQRGYKIVYQIKKIKNPQILFVTTCNWINLNNEDYIESFIGLKRTFTEDEKITISCPCIVGDFTETSIATYSAAIRILDLDTGEELASYKALFNAKDPVQLVSHEFESLPVGICMIEIKLFQNNKQIDRKVEKFEVIKK